MELRLTAASVGTLALLCGSSNAIAQTLVEETFTGYPDNALVSATPAGAALGLIGDWNLTPNSNFYVNRTQLDMTDGTGKAVYDRPSGDNGTRTARRSTSADHVLLTSDADVIYAAFLIEPALSNGRMTFELHLRRLDGGGAIDLSFGVLDGAYAIGNGGVDIDVSGGTATDLEQRVVLKVEYGDGGTGADDYEVLSLWVDPVDEASPRVIDSVSVDLLNRGGAELVGISMRGEQMGGRPAPFDDLWVGLSFPALGPPLEGAPFCLGDGSDGFGCPCVNVPLLGALEGCTNSSGLGVRLVGSGVPSVAADSLMLSVAGAPANEFGIFVQNLGTGAGAAYYDGTLCLSIDSHLVRHYAPPAVLPTLTGPDGTGTNAQPLTVGDFLGDTQPGVTVHYQYWYRDSTGPCATGANLSNGWSVAWGA